MTHRSRLEELGFNLHDATPEQIAAVESLSDEELGLLVKIKSRLEATTGDVEGHVLDGGGLVW